MSLSFRNDRDGPGAAVLDHARHCDVSDARQARLCSNESLRSLHREREAGPAAVVVEQDSPGKVLV